MINRVHAVIGAASLALGLSLGAAGAVADTLRLLTWEEYVAPEVIAKFERESGHKIELVPIVSSEKLLSALRATGADFDLATPSDYQVSLLIGEGRLQPINADTLDNYPNIEEHWRQPPYDRNNLYTVPFHWGTTSFVVDTAQFHGDIDTYRVLFDPPEALKGKVSFLVGAAEVIRMAMIHLGLPPCSADKADIDRALGLIRSRLNPDLIANIGNAVEVLASDKVAIGVAWNGDALRARLKKPSLRYAYPREGVPIWADALAVPVGARHVKAARAFIDFMLRPENAGLQSNFTRYANSIRGSDAFMAPEIIEAPETIVPSPIKPWFMQFCGPETVNLYDKLYNIDTLHQAP